MASKAGCNGAAATKPISSTNLFAFLDDDKIENTQTPVYDAAMNRLASPLSLASRPETRVALREEELHSPRSEDPLFHGEPLLIIAA